MIGIGKDRGDSYFFHKSFKTCIAEIRQHQKMRDSDSGDVCWQKSGKSKPMIVDGKHHGYKTMMILYENARWVMHQYHLGVEKIDQEEFVVSKIFYQRTGQVNRSVEDLALGTDETVLGEAGSLIFSKLDSHLDLVNADATSQVCSTFSFCILAIIVESEILMEYHISIVTGKDKDSTEVRLKYISFLILDILCCVRI